MAKLTTEHARDLAEHFYRLSKTLGDYRFANWEKLGKNERHSIEAIEWSLLNASSDFTAAAVDISLDDVAPVVKRVALATKDEGGDKTCGARGQGALDRFGCRQVGRCDRFG